MGFRDQVETLPLFPLPNRLPSTTLRERRFGSVFSILCSMMDTSAHIHTGIALRFVRRPYSKSALHPSAS